MNLIWTPERIEILQKLASELLSAAEIARAFGGLFTRNAIIGKCRRNGIELCGSQVRRPSGPSIPSIAITASSKHQGVRMDMMAEKIASAHLRHILAAPVPSPDDCVNPVRFMDLERWHCRWIEGEPSADAMCCGARRVDGMSYCSAHAQRAYRHERVPRMRAAE